MFTDLPTSAAPLNSNPASIVFALSASVTCESCDSKEVISMDSPRGGKLYREYYKTGSNTKWGEG